MAANLQSVSCFETPHNSGLFILIPNQPPLHFKRADVQLEMIKRKHLKKKKKLSAKPSGLKQRDSAVRLV